jgi:hypothetical protein
MPAASVHLIVFSKDRPLQLHGMLTSVFRHWRGDVRVTALVRAEAPYRDAYAAVRGQFAQVAWCAEEDFGPDLLALALEGREPLVCFGTDDVVYVAPVDVPTVERLFATPDLLGVSLRLGKNVVCDMFGRTQRQPFFLHQGVYDPAATSEAWPYWRVDADGAVGDWAYPWEVLGTVYPAPFALEVVEALQREGLCANPSQLEHHGSLRWTRHAATGRLMASYPRSRLVVPTVNLVQSEFGNGIVGGTALSPAFLLDCWDHGLRLDPDHLRGMCPTSWRVGDFPLRRVL